MAKGKTDGQADVTRIPAEVLYDDAMEAAGLDPRADGESFSDHRDRIAVGPYTKQQLDAVAENASRFRFAETMRAAQSAREYHKDPNPADTHPRPQ